MGQSGDVRGDTVTSWKERLPEILRGYDKRDVFNIDKTGCFWRALPDRGFGQKRKKCKGGKWSKCRFTIAFLVNADGEKETLIVIWTSESPRCFRGFNISCLPVKYYHQKNAWMSGEILVSYLHVTTFKEDQYCCSLTTQAVIHLINYKTSFLTKKLPSSQLIQPLNCNRWI